jgi:hypothetical protein
MEVLENDSEVITAILFEEISYINDSEEGGSVILGFPRAFMREPIPLLFSEVEAHDQFINVVRTRFDKVIIIITKDDMRVY